MNDPSADRATDGTSARPATRKTDQAKEKPSGADVNAGIKQVLRVADQYYVLATSVLADHETRVLKQGETFAIFDAYGDLQPVTHSESGVFHRGTRHLSRYEFTFESDNRPLLLNSTLRDDNGLLKVDMTNRDFTVDGDFFAKGTVHIHREKFVLDSKCYEQISVENFGPFGIDVAASLHVGADFADIFEVRGTKRARRGTSSAWKRDGAVLHTSYEGLDGIRRDTRIEFVNIEFEFENDAARFRIKADAKSKISFQILIHFQQGGESQEKVLYKEGMERIRSDHDAGRSKYCNVKSSNEQFNTWMRRSTDDLVMMTTLTEEGTLIPYAGIPWFCAPFGRDSVITALECLWSNPKLALGVLRYLAATQAHEKVIERDSTPGKIIHEVRDGEMANLKEVPFGRYYGSVDSTPLFVLLGGCYLERTGDLDLIRELWPAVERAILWLDRYGDLDGDGFIEYQRENPNGLVQQGWKDSHDSVFHDDGSDAPGPIALAEVQAYTYMALVEGARMAEALGHADVGLEWRKRASCLKDRFDEAFWMEDLGTYALALDGTKRPCRIATSNAGQCLFTGIVKPERAARLAKTLMSPESFSGWGVRTAATSAARYNPMSYHNGSVWPHDVALVALGLAKYGFKDDVERLFKGLFSAAKYMELMRMPEVFCGFVRHEGEAPTLYPNACSPQAWAAGSVYMLLEALLGLKINAIDRTVSFYKPRLPDSIETLRIKNLQVGSGCLDILVQNYHSDVSVQIDRRGEGISVLVEK